jgi:glycosyltransferase involved in cell wall biosynthesis
MMGNVDKKWYTLFLVGGEDISLRIPAIKHLKTLNYNVCAVGSESKFSFRGTGITYYKYSLDRGFTPIKDIITIFELIKLFSSERPDIVHTFDTKPNILAVIAARVVGVSRVIRTINGMGKIFTENIWQMYFFKMIYIASQFCVSTMANFTIYQNLDDLKYFVTRGLISPKKARYVAGSGVSVENLIDSIGNPECVTKLKHELGLNGQCVVILVSRIIIAKGILEYLECARFTSTESLNIKFLLVGPLEPQSAGGLSRSLIDEFSGVCSYLGYRTDVSTLISLSDIVVLPSCYKEGVPRALIEGAALSKALVTTDISGCRDIVLNRYNGLLVPVKSVLKLSEAIVYLAENSDIRTKMGKNGKELVMKKFSLSKVCEGWRQLYR